MAAISSIDAKTPTGAFAANRTTLGSSDTITFTASKRQLLIVDNDGGSSLPLKIDGDGGTTVAVDGVGAVDVSGGLTITIPAGESRAVFLDRVSAYCQGVVTLTGASGAKARLLNVT